MDEQTNVIKNQDEKQSLPLVLENERPMQLPNVCEI